MKKPKLVIKLTENQRLELRRRLHNLGIPATKRKRDLLGAAAEYGVPIPGHQPTLAIELEVIAALCEDERLGNRLIDIAADLK